MTRPPFEILFLCSGNSARSIMAEAILNQAGRGRFHAHSAGSNPVGTINPHAAALLRNLGVAVENLRSKSWHEFTGPDAPEFDFIITVCDTMAGEACPALPGMPMRTHWSIPDPVTATGSEAEIAVIFAETYRMLKNRIDILVNLPPDKLGGLAMKRHLESAGAA
jgi:protein-tyrosine-phosphatase